MYDRLRGVLLLKTPTRAVVEVGGVGYELTIPLSTFEALPGEDLKATLFTHLYVREDALRLFGFKDAEERRFFRRLLEVGGIGPAVALSILSSTLYVDFRDAVLAEDVRLLTRLKGVGKKLAQRIILELKDPLEREAPDLPRTTRPDLANLREDGITALVTLGFARGAARKEVDRILGAARDPVDLGEIVRLALRSAR